MSIETFQYFNWEVVFMDPVGVRISILYRGKSHEMRLYLLQVQKNSNLVEETEISLTEELKERALFSANFEEEQVF